MSRFLTSATWDDAPHLTAEAREALYASIPAYQRDARTKGIPQLGAGLIYQVPESELKVADFPIPAHFKRAYGLDAGGGAKPTAAVWGALDTETDILYLTHVYKRSSPETAVHAGVIKARGAWMPGVGDAAALIITQHDAEQLIKVYKRAGLDLELPDKGVETGIQDVVDRMTTGRLKVFASCSEWFTEYRLYRRDKRGRVVKVNDHLMDGTRYLVRSGLKRAKTRPIEKPEPTGRKLQGRPLGWMR